MRDKAKQSISNIVHIYQTETDPEKEIIMATHIKSLSDQLEKLTPQKLFEKVYET